MLRRASAGPPTTPWAVDGSWAGRPIFRIDPGQDIACLGRIEQSHRATAPDTWAQRCPRRFHLDALQ